jgi:hypothetical protein
MAIRFPRREGSRKPIQSGHSVNPSDPWGTGDFTKSGSGYTVPKKTPNYPSRTAGRNPDYKSSDGKEDRFKDGPSYRNDID